MRYYCEQTKTIVFDMNIVACGVCDNQPKCKQLVSKEREPRNRLQSNLNEPPLPETRRKKNSKLNYSDFSMPVSYGVKTISVGLPPAVGYVYAISFRF